MLSRRDLLMGVPAAASLRPAAAPAANEINPRDLSDIRDALRDLRHLTPLSEVTQIQEKQHVFFKANQKFPNYIEIGLTVWERLTMWHLENRLPLRAVRTPEGRMEMDFLFTTLVLKPDIADVMIGIPYD
jgi:hypothetical protein